MQTSIRQWGNSQGLCIPKDMLRQLDWSVHDNVEISISDEKIIIERVRPKSIKEAAFEQIRQLRRPAPDLDARLEMQEYLEERYEDK